jgi:hypothetical protein
MRSGRHPKHVPLLLQPVPESPNQSQRCSCNRGHSVPLKDQEAAVLERRCSSDEGSTKVGEIDFIVESLDADLSI